MLRTSTALLTPTGGVKAKLREYAEQSAILWNISNYERRRAHQQHAKIPSYANQCKSLKYNETFKKLGVLRELSDLEKRVRALLSNEKNQHLGRFTDRSEGSSS